MNALKEYTTAAKMHPAWIPMDHLIAPVSRGSLVTDAHVQVNFVVLFTLVVSFLCLFFVMF